MKRVVVTGMGAATPIGNLKSVADAPMLTTALLNGQVGIAEDPDFAEAGFRSTVSGRVDGLDDWLAGLIEADPSAFKMTKRNLGKGDTLKLALLPAIAAFTDAGLNGVEAPVLTMIGSGGPSSQDQCRAGIHLHEGGEPRGTAIGPFIVPPTMSSGPSAIVSTHLKTTGGAISLTSACATGTHNIGFAFQEVALGKRLVALAGGADDCHVTKAVGFEAMRKALYSGDLPPDQASRPFDANRGGFVDSAGGAVLVLEEFEHALQRGARIYAEVVGFDYTSDGADMVAPDGKGAERAIRTALRMAGDPRIDYVNAHGTSTPEGDSVEMATLDRVFGANKPLVTSTKAQVGHSLGGAGAVEAVFTILMMNAGVVGGQVNLVDLDQSIANCGWEEYIPRKRAPCAIEYAMSNSFGFGGTNGVLVFKRYSGA